MNAQAKQAYIRVMGKWSRCLPTIKGRKTDPSVPIMLSSPQMDGDIVMELSIKVYSEATELESPNPGKKLFILFSKQKY